MVKQRANTEALFGPLLGHAAFEPPAFGGKVAYVKQPEEGDFTRHNRKNEPWSDKGHSLEPDRDGDQGKHDKQPRGDVSEKGWAIHLLPWPGYGGFVDEDGEAEQEDAGYHHVPGNSVVSN